MSAHPDQAESNCKQIRMTFRACIKISIDVDCIGASINNQIMKTPHDLLVHLAALDSGIKSDIGTLKK